MVGGIFGKVTGIGMSFAPRVEVFRNGKKIFLMINSVIWGPKGQEKYGTSRPYESLESKIH